MTFCSDSTVNFSKQLRHDGRLNIGVNDPNRAYGTATPSRRRTRRPGIASAFTAGGNENIANLTFGLFTNELIQQQLGALNVR